MSAATILKLSGSKQAYQVGVKPHRRQPIQALLKLMLRNPPNLPTSTRLRLGPLPIKTAEAPAPSALLPACSRSSPCEDAFTRQSFLCQIYAASALLVRNIGGDQLFH